MNNKKKSLRYVCTTFFKINFVTFSFRENLVYDLFMKNIFRFIDKALCRNNIYY